MRLTTNYNGASKQVIVSRIDHDQIPSRHLTHEQICDLLLADKASPATAEQETHQQHLDSCLICTSEVDVLRTSVRSFRDVSVALADRALARKASTRPFSSIASNRPARYLTPAFFWAATGILFAAVLPLGLFHQNLNPFLKPHSAPMTATSTANTTPTLESDEALLEDINQDLSASIPSAMQPLAGPVSSSTASTQSASTQTTKRIIR